MVQWLRFLASTATEWVRSIPGQGTTILQAMPRGPQKSNNKKNDSLDWVIATIIIRASLVAQLVKNPPAMWETWVWSLGWEDALEKEVATQSNILAWRIPWTVQSMGSQRVRYDWVTFTHNHYYWYEISENMNILDILINWKHKKSNMKMHSWMSWIFFLSCRYGWILLLAEMRIWFLSFFFS